MAAMQGHISVVKCLITHGANVNAVAKVWHVYVCCNHTINIFCYIIACMHDKVYIVMTCMYTYICVLL